MLPCSLLAAPLGFFNLPLVCSSNAASSDHAARKPSSDVGQRCCPPHSLSLSLALVCIPLQSIDWMQEIGCKRRRGSKALMGGMLTSICV